MTRRTDPSAETVRLVRERDDWRCARCAGWGPLSTQHRVARGMGGSRWAGINLPSNLLTLCGSGTTGCHGWVEGHPLWAMGHGWAVSKYDREAVSRLPVWTWRGWVYLTEQGRAWAVDDHPGLAGCDCGCRPLETTTGVWDTPMGDREA